MHTNYGKSDFYDGQAGRQYFHRQNAAGRLNGKLNAWKFTPWVSDGKDILDFGCGGGWLLRELPGKKKIGIDVNPAARAFCEENGVAVYEAISALPAGLSFNVIISHHCLEHVPYPIQALRELRQRLNAEGRFVIVVPIDDWRVQRDSTGQDPDHHLHTWTPRLLANTLSEAGFICERVDVLTHAWPRGWEQLHRMLPAWCFELVCRFWGILVKRRQLRAVAMKRRDAKGD